METEQPLHPTPMNHPMMKGKMTVDPSNKPTFQGIWGMTHADVNKGGYTNDFKVVRMASIKVDEDSPVFPGNYQGYFKLATVNNLIETVPETFSLRFVAHTNHGHNVYGEGSNKYGHYEIVGTITQSGKMEIFKITLDAAGQAGADQGGSVSAATPRSKAAPKNRPKASSKKAANPPDNKFGMPGIHVKTMREALLSLKKSDKKMVFQYPVPPNFRGQRGLYSDIIKSPMDLGTVMTNIDEKYRTVEECIEDIRLVFRNARFFNLDTDPVNALATSLSGRFEAFLSTHRKDLSSNRAEASGSRPGDNSSEAPPAVAPTDLVPTAPVGVGGLGKRLSAPLPAPPLSSASSVAPVPPLPMAGGGGGTGEKGNGNSSSNGKGAAEKAVTALSWEEQDELAKNVNEIFRLANEQPDNERAQARVYALWTFAKAYVAEKDIVMLDGGKGADIRVDALNVKRQRQLQDVVNFFLDDQVNDPPSQPKADQDPKSMLNGGNDHRPGDDKSGRQRERGTADGGARKRSRSDLSESEDDDEDGDGIDDDASPDKRSRDGSAASWAKAKSGLDDDALETRARDTDTDGGEDDYEGLNRNNHAMTTAVGGGSIEQDSTRLILEATAGQETEINLNLDLEDEEEDDEDDDQDDAYGQQARKRDADSVGEGSGDDADFGEMDSQWTQAQEEKKERERRERFRAENEKALEEQRLKDQEMRQRARVEEGLKLSRERAAEKQRLEALALDRRNKEKAELEEKKEAERAAREAEKASVDLDQCRSDAKLMNVMDQAVYDD